MSGAGRGTTRPSPAWRSMPPAVEMIGAQLFNGVCAYVFLGITTRQLGDVEFAPLSVAWSAFFLIGTGCFLPLEQQLSRNLAARHAAHGAAPSAAGNRVLIAGSWSSRRCRRSERRSPSTNCSRGVTT